MTRPSKLCGLLVAFLALCVIGSLATDEERPNIVVIISDDQAYHDFGFMGHEVIQTPHLDRLAEQSLVYRRGYVTTALCAPSLATMQTGMYPHQHGWTGNDPSKEAGGWAKRQEWIDRYSQAPQLPALLAEAGYLSLHTGKYWQGDPQKISGFTHSMGETQRHGSKASLGVGRDGMQPIYDFIGEAQEQEKPFMVWYAPFMPHTPHTPPERLYKKYKDKTKHESHAKYFAMVDWLDETCGELLAHLDDKGLADNTVVLFICDNGWPHGDSGYRGHVSKLTPWEQGVRTPIMVRWPGHIAPGSSCSVPVSSPDMYPTILDLAGLVLVPEQHTDGVSLKPLLLGGQTPLDRDALYWHYPHYGNQGGTPGAAIRMGDWKLIEFFEDNRLELYNLRDDISEAHNLAYAEPARAAAMHARLTSWQNGMNAKYPVPNENWGINSELD